MDGVTIYDACFSFKTIKEAPSRNRTVHSKILFTSRFSIHFWLLYSLSFIYRLPPCVNRNIEEEKKTMFRIIFLNKKNLQSRGSASSFIEKSLSWHSRRGSSSFSSFDYNPHNSNINNSKSCPIILETLSSSYHMKLNHSNHHNQPYMTKRMTQPQQYRSLMTTNIDFSSSIILNNLIKTKSLTSGIYSSSKACITSSSLSPSPSSSATTATATSTTTTISQQSNGSFIIPVLAIHIAEKIDLVSTLSKVFGNQSSTMKRKMYGNKYLSYSVIQLNHLKTNQQQQSINNNSTTEKKKSDHDTNNMSSYASYVANQFLQQQQSQASSNPFLGVATTPIDNNSNISRNRSIRAAAGKSDHNLVDEAIATVKGNSNNNNTTTSSSINRIQKKYFHRSPGFVAIFPFGSVVLFNIPPNEVSMIIHHIKQYSTDPVVSGSERKESFSVLVQEDDIVTVDNEYNNHNNNHNTSNSSNNNNEALMMNNDHVHHTITSDAVVDNIKANATNNDEKHYYNDVTPDYCIVHNELDMNGVAVISNIMAQTVALDTYSDMVDELLNNFAAINSTVKKTGKFTSTDRHFLFKTVAQNNSIFIDMISKTRIKDRNDTAWVLTKYQKIYDGLKHEFEIDDRFENIEFKLNLIQHNAKFFMEVLHHQSSNNLEWIIVVLILAECILMIVEMSGNSTHFFGTISNIVSTIIPSSTTSTLPMTTPNDVIATTSSIETLMMTDGNNIISPSLTDTACNDPTTKHNSK